MQKLIHSLFIVILFTKGLTAQNNFTLEQVILERESLLPKSLSQLQWIPDTDDFTYLDSTDVEIKLIKENAMSEGKEILLTLTGLNESIDAKGLNTLESFPVFAWTSSSTIQFWNDLSFVEYNFKNNSLSIINDIALNGTNADFNDPHKIAYTIDNNLYISTSSGVYLTNSTKTSKFEVNSFKPVKGTFEQSWGFRYFRPPGSELIKNNKSSEEKKSPAKLPAQYRNTFVLFLCSCVNRRFLLHEYYSYRFTPN